MTNACASHSAQLMQQIPCVTCMICSHITRLCRYNLLLCGLSRENMHSTRRECIEACLQLATTWQERHRSLQKQHHHTTQARTVPATGLPGYAPPLRQHTLLFRAEDACSEIRAIATAGVRRRNAVGPAGRPHSLIIQKILLQPSAQQRRVCSASSGHCPPGDQVPRCTAPLSTAERDFRDRTSSFRDVTDLPSHEQNASICRGLCGAMRDTVACASS